MSRDINELQKHETLKQNQKRYASPFFPISSEIAIRDIFWSDFRQKVISGNPCMAKF